MVSFLLQIVFQIFKKEKFINILSILVVSSILFILILLIVCFYNLEIFSNNISEKLPIIIYLKDNISDKEVQSIMDLLENKIELASTKFISKLEAINELRKNFKDISEIFEGLDSNPLSISIEIRLKKEFVNSNYIKQFSDEISHISGIDNIYYPKKTLIMINDLRKIIRNIGVLIFVPIICSVIIIIHGTIQIIFYRKKEDVELLSLLGASRSFIRRPFLFEGGIIGFISGFVGAFSIWGFYLLLLSQVSKVLPLVKNIIFPIQIIFLLPIVGVILGVIGAMVAISKLKHY